MAQTTAALSFKDVKIEISTDGGSSWTDISGEANAVNVSGGERITGNAKTADGDTPIIKAGKREPVLVTVSALYTETAAAAYDKINDAYEAGDEDVQIRWSPEGATVTGQLQYTTADGIVKQPVYPSGNAEDGVPVPIEIVVETPSVTEASFST